MRKLKPVNNIAPTKNQYIKNVLKLYLKLAQVKGIKENKITIMLVC